MSDLDRPDYHGGCEATVFHGRDEDDWYLLEWWGEGIGWAVYKMPDRSIYSDDSGPATISIQKALRDTVDFGDA